MKTQKRSDCSASEAQRVRAPVAFHLGSVVDLRLQVLELVVQRFAAWFVEASPLASFLDLNFVACRNISPLALFLDLDFVSCRRIAP